MESNSALKHCSSSPFASAPRLESFELCVFMLNLYIQLWVDSFDNSFLSLLCAFTYLWSSNFLDIGPCNRIIPNFVITIFILFYFWIVYIQCLSCSRFIR